MAIKSYVLNGERVKIGSKAERELLGNRARPSQMEGLEGVTSKERRTGSYLTKKRNGMEMSNLYTPKRNKDRSLTEAVDTGDFSKVQNRTIPTVLSDTNIRDNVIPDLNSRANKLTLGIDPNAQRPGETPEQYNVRLTSTSSADSGTSGEADTYESMLSGLGFSSGGTSSPGVATPETVDPIEQQSLNLLKKMQQSVDANAKAQLRSIESMYNVRQQQMQNSIASEGAALRTALRQAGSRYTPGSSGGAMTGQEQQGILRLAELDAEEQAAIADVKSAQQSGNFQLLEKQLAIAERKREEKIQQRQQIMKMIADNNAEIAKAKAKIVEDVNKIAQDAAKGGASPEVIDAILASKDVGSAIKAAGSNLVSGSGVIGEYLFYKREAEARGQVPMDFNAYADMDANRKRPVISAAGSGLPNQVITQIDKLSSSFDSSPIVKQFNEVQNKKLSVDSIINSEIKGPADLAIVYEFMKALDPTSVVREAEYATAAKSGNIFAGTLAKFNGYLKEGGGFLPENVRTEFQNLINKKFDVAKSQYKNLKSETARKINMKTGAEDGEDYLTNYEGASVAQGLLDKETQAETKVTEKARNNPQLATQVETWLTQNDPDLGRPLTFLEIIEIFPEYFN